MTEAILTVGIFAVPILAVAIIEQRKMELERRKRELALMREMEQIIQFKHGMAYRKDIFESSNRRLQIYKRQIKLL